MTAAVVPQTTVPGFDTHIPFVGVIDFSNKMEWVYWGGMVGTILFVKSNAKWLIVAGILALRYEMERSSS
jgi:hypothetical protein